MGFNNNRWFRAEVQQVTDAAPQKLTEDELAYIRTNMKNTFLGLGYDLPSEPNIFCHSGKDLRIFQMKEDGTLGAIPPGEHIYSESFIEKMQRGQIFAFPAGDEEPVQLQIRPGKDGSFPTFQCSKPIEGNPVRKPVENPPRPLSGWQSFWNRLSGGRFYKAKKADYIARKQEYDKQMAPWIEGDKKLAELKEGRKAYQETELVDYEAETVRRDGEETDRKKQALRDLRAADMEKDLLKGSTIGTILDRMQTVYCSKPVPEDEVVANRTYTAEQHRQLVQYDLNKVRTEKLTVDDRRFMMLGVLAAGTDEIAGNMRLDQPGAMELSAKERINTTICNITTDLAEESGRGRAGIGKFFGQVQQARGKAYDALKAYAENDPKPLAALIARGIHQGVEFMEHRGLGSKSTLATQLAYAEGLELLEKDDKLMAAAKEAGLTDPDIRVAKSCVEKTKLTCRNERAEKLLSADAKKELDPPLTQEERKEYLEDVLRYKVVDQSIETYLDAQKGTQKYKENIQAHLDRRNEVMRQKGEVVQKKVKKEIDPQEADRQIKEFDKSILSEATIMQGKMGQTFGVPEVQYYLAEDPKKTVDAMLDLKLRHRDKLLELSPEKLLDALNDRKIFAPDSPYATTEEEKKSILAVKEPGKAGPEQKEPDKAPVKTEPEKGTEAEKLGAGIGSI